MHCSGTYRHILRRSWSVCLIPQGHILLHCQWHGPGYTILTAIGQSACPWCIQCSWRPCHFIMPLWVVSLVWQSTWSLRFTRHLMTIFMFTGVVHKLGKPIALTAWCYAAGADELALLNITSFQHLPLCDQLMLAVVHVATATVFVLLTIGGGRRP